MYGNEAMMYDNKVGWDPSKMRAPVTWPRLHSGDGEEHPSVRALWMNRSEGKVGDDSHSWYLLGAFYIVIVCVISDFNIFPLLQNQA